jgi:hypothetical protein
MFIEGDVKELLIFFMFIAGVIVDNNGFVFGTEDIGAT